MSASSRVLDEDGICRGYKMAKDKAKQLQILADLNAIKKKDVIEILAKYGLITDQPPIKSGKSYSREYYLRHKERIGARNREYARQHREEIRRKSREKYAKQKAAQTADTV